MKPVWKNPPAIVEVWKVELAIIFKVVAARLVKKPLVEVTLVPLALVKAKRDVKMLVEVTEVPLELVNVRPDENRLVEVTLVVEMLVAIKLVEVTIVPEAEVKFNWPDNVPPVSKR